MRMVLIRMNLDDNEKVTDARIFSLTSNSSAKGMRLPLPGTEIFVSVLSL